MQLLRSVQAAEILRTKPAMRGLLLLLLSCSLLAGCRRKSLPPAAAPAPINTLVAGTYITGPGNWTYSDKNFFRKLEVTTWKNRIIWDEDVRQGSGGSHGGSYMNLKSLTDPWFIYVESPQVLWFCDGSESLKYEATPHGVISLRQAILKTAIEEKCVIPLEIIPRLPAAMQEVIPEARKRKPPSI